MIKTICFFNHWHNGDVFAGKGYMQDLIRQVRYLRPDMRFQHAQVNSLKTMRDLPCEHLRIEDLPPQITDTVPVLDIGTTLYVNTWVGVYGASIFPEGQEHANYVSLNKMWMHIHFLFKELLGIELVQTLNVAEYIATTDWAYYDLSPAERWLGQHENVAIICNGKVHSTQSRLGAMQTIVRELSRDFPDINWVCTSKIDIDEFENKHNVFFTDDIFAGVEDGDINEIAFLSTRAFLIVGKNSGPFMFTHLQENLLDPNKIFVSLSHRSSDSYCWGIAGIKCRYYHFSGDDPANAAGVIRNAVWNRGQIGPGELEELGVREE